MNYGLHFPVIPNLFIGPFSLVTFSSLHFYQYTLPLFDCLLVAVAYFCSVPVVFFFKFASLISFHDSFLLFHLYFYYYSLGPYLLITNIPSAHSLTYFSVSPRRSSPLSLNKDTKTGRCKQA